MKTTNDWQYAWLSRLSKLMAVVVAMSVALPRAEAVDRTWVGTTSTAWMTTTNWSGSTTPGANDVAVFENAGTATNYVLNFNSSPAVTGTYTLGAISVTSTRTTNDWTLGNSSTTRPQGVLAFNGQTIGSTNNVIISNASGKNMTFNAVASGSLTMSILLNNASQNVIDIGDVGGITITSTITSAANRLLTLQGAGSGVLTLSAANTYTGTTRLSATTIRAGNNDAFSSTLLQLNGGTLASDSATARSFTNNVTIGGDVAFGDATGTGALNFAGNVGLGGATRTLTTTVSTTFAGAVTNGSLTKAGAATLALTNSGNSFGTLTVNTGTVSIGANTTVTGLAGSGGGLNLSAGTLTVNASADQTFALPIGGSGSFTKAGAGNLTLSGNNTYSGATVVDAGTLTTATTTAISTNVTVASDATLALGAAQTFTALSGNGTLAAGNSAMTFNIASTSTFGGTLTGNSSSSLTKTGAGTMNFTGNTADYAGTVSVTQGTITGLSFGTGTVSMSGGNAFGESGGTIANSFVIVASQTSVFYSQNFNSIGSGLPADWTVRIGATESSVGTVGSLTTTHVNWATSTGQFANYASATGLTSTSGTAAQAASTDRALGVRPTNTFGDPGAAFNYAFSTTDQTIESVSIDLMMLDVQARSTTWSIQYGSGTDPSSFTTLGTWTDPGTWGTTPLSFSGTAVSGMSNLSNGVFRVVALTSSTGSGSRDSIAIDNFQMVAATTTPASAQLGINEAGSTTFSGPIAVTGTANLFATTGGTATFSGAISGSSGVLTKSGAGTVVLTGANSYGGNVAVQAGRLQGNAASLLNNVAVAAGAELLFNQTSTGTFTGIVSGSGSLTKTGAGVLAITNAQTFTGPITISAGALALSGSGSLASSLITVAADGTLDASGRSGGLTLASGQTLAGTGTVDGLVVVGGGATVSPGNSPGILNADAFEFAAGGNFNWQIFDLASPAGTGWDLLSGTGAMSITAGTTLGEQFNVNLWSLAGIGPDVSGLLAGFDPDADYAFKFADFAGGITGFESAKFFVNTAGTNGTDGFANTLNGQFSIAIGSGIAVGDGDTALYIVYTAIPEPSTVVLACLGLAVMGCAARRRRLTTAATRS
jgi:fibronectin-binding autotransporter adhesin